MQPLVNLQKLFPHPRLLSLPRYLLLCVGIGLLSGTASALFLTLLDLATAFRGSHNWLIYFLPLGGLLIGWGYQRFGGAANAGNDLLFRAADHPAAHPLPLRMAPMVLLGTVLTHLFGGSAGREGTAVQMGAALADRWGHRLKLPTAMRPQLVLLGIAGGFASVFGTPVAGAFFGLQMLRRPLRAYGMLLPALLTAFVAHYSCLAWGVHHTDYGLSAALPAFGLTSAAWTILAGSCFGLAAILFVRSHQLFHRAFQLIPQPMLRPLLGGSLIALYFAWSGSDRYLGLGLPVLTAAFDSQVLPYDFLLKILFTTFTLAAGFKGGEVTPLFFIGACLGNALCWFIPLPMPLLAGIGMVAVFAAATKTPLACTLMGMELFGPAAGLYLALACTIAWLCSGPHGIYSLQARADWRRFWRWDDKEA